MLSIFLSPIPKNQVLCFQDQFIASLCTYQTAQASMPFITMKGSISATSKYNQLRNICDVSVIHCLNIPIKWLSLRFKFSNKFFSISCTCLVFVQAESQKSWKLVFLFSFIKATKCTNNIHNNIVLLLLLLLLYIMYIIMYIMCTFGWFNKRK